MNILKRLINCIKLLSVQFTVNYHRIYGDNRIKLITKSLTKRTTLNTIRVKINGTTSGILVYSRKKGQPNVLYLDYIWINKKLSGKIIPDEESPYYQVMYDIFMQWYERNTITLTRIALPLNVHNEKQVERFRRILTLYGFSVDEELTLRDVTFTKPYRERETITNVIYSRKV